MNTNARKFTNAVIRAVEDGYLDWEIVARACLDYMSEDEVADMVDINDWAIIDEEDVEEDEDEKEDEDDSLSEETLDKIWEIADRYNTSSPVSGNWDTEIIHERDALVKELGLTKKEANEVMVKELGFDILDIEIAERKFGEKVFNENLITKEVCPECEKELGEDGHCYNQECVAYDPVSQYLEEQVGEDVLVKNGYYDELDFHEAGLLIGDIELQYEKLPVIDQFDEDIEIDHTFIVFISPDMVIDFLCAQRGLDRKKFTASQAQKHIDDLAKNPKDFYQYLKEHFAEEATEEAQYKIAESYKYKAKENFELDDDDDVLGWGEK